MLPATKHFDVVVGVDVHVLLTPAGVPAPVPLPFTGFLFDPMDYLPGGATVRINGLPRAHAGTSAVAVPPHLPIGGAFVKPPANDGELFMGSATVGFDGEPQGYSGLPVLTCQDVGMPSPPRAGKKQAPRSLYLPTSQVIAIPAAGVVAIGGPPTISMGVLTQALGPLAQRLRSTFLKSKRGAKLNRKLKVASIWMNAVASRVFEKVRLPQDGCLRNQVSRSICTITGHPVDVATGKVFTEHADLTLPGPLPFRVERVWYSSSSYDGPLGYGWHASFDMALAVDRDAIGLRLGDGRVALFPPLELGEHAFHDLERLELVRDALGYRLFELESGLTYHFIGADVLPLTCIEDRDGNRVRFRHEDRLREIIDSGGRSWSLRWSQGRAVALEGPHPDRAEERVVYQRWSYEDGSLVEARDVLGQAQRFEYRDRLLVRETLKGGLSFQFEYDADRRCVRTWGDHGIYDHKLTYDPLFKRTTVENSLGHKTVYEHDGAMVHRSIDALGNTCFTELDDAYRMVARVDELGQRTMHKYDERGNLVETISPDGTQTTVSYERDLPVRWTNALGACWTWQYDERGRETSRRDPLGNVTRCEYGERGLVAVIDALNGCTQLQRDARGEIVALAGPNGGITRFKRDRLGRAISVEDARGGVQSRTLDLAGRTTEMREPDGNLRVMTYDAQGNLLSARDANSHVELSYCGMSRLATRTEAGTRLQFHYDTEEQLTSIVNEHGHAYSFELGPTGQIDVERGFDGLLRRYHRDRTGQVLRIDRSTDRWTSYTYDPAGRLVAVEYFDGTRESYEYRADGALVAASNDDARVEFERDALGRIVREAQGADWITSEYDALGRRVRVRSSLGLDQRIERDALGEASSVHEQQSGFQARFDRDPLGAELGRTLPRVRSRWSRDLAGRPLEHIVEAGSNTLRAVGYQWDANDRLHTIIDSARGPTRYRHDARGNLAWAHYPDDRTELRIPDSVGNLFRSEARNDRQYGAAGQLLTDGGTRYWYDVDGNLVRKREPSGASWRYAWNASGALSAVTRPDGSDVTFNYDPFGRRLSKTFEGRTTRWLWDGDVPLQERVTGAPPITWLFDPESFAPLARIHNGEAESILCDHLGTPVAMVDARGERTWSAAISAYGDLHNLVGDRYRCPFRWPGQYEDAETGLYYNRFRYYDPASGQYASQDPIGLLGGAALYGFVHDPVLWIDPWGLSETCGPRPTKHIHNRHIARAKYSDKSKYRKPSQLDKLIARTLNAPDGVIEQSDGRIRYIKIFDRKIGTRGETINRVVVDPRTNKIVTAHPMLNMTTAEEAACL
jgi:RHS repeat-associated protein